MVVIGHNTPVKDYPILNSVIYAFHMPLFFIISGFLFSPKNPRTYFINSFNRLIIPFFAFCVILALPEIMKWLLSIKTDENIPNLKKAIGRIYNGCICSTAGWYTITWFVSVLWMSNNLFNYITAKKIKNSWVIFMIALGYLSGFIPGPLPFRIRVVPMSIAYIWIGHIIKMNILEFSKRRIFILILGAVSVVLVSILGIDMRIDMKFAYYGIPVVSFVLSIILSVALGVIAVMLAEFSLGVKILCLLGEASMVIMYLHIPCQIFPIIFPILKQDLIYSIVLGLIIPTCVFLICKKNNLLSGIFIGSGFKNK